MPSNSMIQVRAGIAKSLKNLARVVAWGSLMYLATVFVGFVVSTMLPRMADVGQLGAGCYWVDGLVPHVACTGLPFNQALSAVLSQWLSMIYLPTVGLSGLSAVSALLLWAPAVYLLAYGLTAVFKTR